MEEHPVPELLVLLGLLPLRATEEGQHPARGRNHLGPVQALEVDLSPRAGVLGPRVVAAGVDQQQLEPGLARFELPVNVVERDQRRAVGELRVRGAEVGRLLARELDAVPCEGHHDRVGRLQVLKQETQLLADVRRQR